MNFYIADTHFGHKNILKLCDHPFENIGVDINGFASVTLDEMICNNNVYKGR